MVVNETHVTTFIVLGASGHLAKTKTFPALFQIYQNDLMPSKLSIFGYARSKMSQSEFHNQLRPFLKGDASKVDGFLELCFYHDGQYNDKASFAKLHEVLKEHEGGPSNRVFYMALPPSVFLTAARSIQPEAMSPTGWNRVIIEKPFGHDYESAVELGDNLLDIFDEDQMFRIDHYLGKEMVQNILTMRFANAIFEPIWTRLRIKAVSITFKENFGTEGRGGYFDGFGIVRDVMQNHLLQILSLIAMEPPSSLEANDVRDAKNKVLRQVRTISMDDVVLGQYTKSADGSKPGYLDDETVPEGSNCPTYAVAVLHIDNERWSGVPFIMKAGKALEERKAEIRIQFQAVRNHLYPHEETTPNELVFRVQPDEAVYLKIVSKDPGLSNKRIATELDLTYKHRYAAMLPEAYTVLILDAIRGDHSLFVRNDELLEAWRIFTPMLHKIEDKESGIKPILYEYGSRGPPEGDLMRKKYGMEYHEGYRWNEQAQSYKQANPKL
jgi:glucose-6-phosphate 1-dehydrogenase